MILSNECSGVKTYWDLWLYNLPGKACRKHYYMKLVRNDAYIENSKVIFPEYEDDLRDRIEFNRILSLSENHCWTLRTGLRGVDNTAFQGLSRRVSG
jgi:hypothetical protein